ncbi:MAG: metallophosphoesterase family protein [Clostridiales bacterium]|nr:metallophosphoesterase family protein [Clostridiales bacterium]
MRILAVADIEDRRLYDFFTKDRVKGVDLIISCGDLKADYLDFLMTMVNVPMAYVRGNHDDNLNAKPPLGGICLEDNVVNIMGYNFLGLGGSMKYHNGLNMFTEKEMRWRTINMAPMATIKGVDVLVTHSPARGYGDLDDLPHRGFECFNKVMNRYHPQLMLHGHVHANYGMNIAMEREHPSGTKIVNAYGYQIIDL